MKLIRKATLLLVLLCFATVLAQDNTCADIVTEALAAVQDACADTGRNQACYGNVSIQATPQDGVTDLQFDQQGDIADLANISSLRLRHLSVERNVWGIALMQLQANLPDALPGQNVTFLLFGDVEIENAADPATETPMQAFYFRTGIADPLGCTDAPSDGILIQTPEGAGEITLRANDVDIQLGSTAYLQAIPGDEMTVSVIEGQGTVTANGETVVIPAGASVGVPLNEDMSAAGAPRDLQPYDESAFLTLPVEVLPREIEVAPAADPQALEDAQTGGDGGDQGDGGDLGGLGGFDPGMFEGMDPAVFCPMFDQILGDAGMTRQEYIDLIEQYSDYFTGEDQAFMEQFLAMLEACP